MPSTKDDADVLAIWWPLHLEIGGTSPDLDRCIRSLTILLDHPYLKKDPLTEGNIALDLAHACIDHADRAGALAALQRADNAFRNAHVSGGHARVLLARARLAIEADEGGKAEKLIGELIPERDSSLSPHTRAEAWNLLGLLNLKRHRAQASLACFNRSRALAAAHDMWSHAARSAALSAHAHLHRHHVSACLQSLRWSLQTALHIGDPAAEGRALLTLARTHALQGRYFTAGLDTRRAIRRFRRAQHPEGLRAAQRLRAHLPLWRMLWLALMAWTGRGPTQNPRRLPLESPSSEGSRRSLFPPETPPNAP